LKRIERFIYLIEAERRRSGQGLQAEAWRGLKCSDTEKLDEGKTALIPTLSPKERAFTFATFFGFPRYENIERCTRRGSGARRRSTFTRIGLELFRACGI
jgi:hypothetical protein